MDEFNIPYNDIPSIDITSGTQVPPALLGPKMDEVYVCFDNMKYISRIDGKTEYELVFLVVVDGKELTVSRRLLIDNRAIAQEAINIHEGKKTLFVENKLSTEQEYQLRRLAGLPT